MNISSADREILKSLFSTDNAMNIYEFYEKLSLSPSHISSFLKKYLEINVVEYNDYKINLTEGGKKWIVKNRYELFLKERKCFWRNIPISWQFKK